MSNIISKIRFLEDLNQQLEDMYFKIQENVPNDIYLLEKVKDLQELVQLGLIISQDIYNENI